MKIIKVAKGLSGELEMVPFRISEDGVYVPYYEDGVQAGFPSPADDFKEQRLSLDAKLLSKPNSTFIVRVKGNSMFDTLHVGDLLIVRADLNLEDNDIGILSVNNNDFTVKRLDKSRNLLVADNEDFPNIEINEDDVIQCRGVVKHLIRDL
ncbi:DNA repair protein [Wenyingzhuangia fucanilytica]|uniref:DNA repair protein n=1 Tax=Wenyingzhuangia fucanilytica TaxID=1790137 RepID=A0A1B1Y9M0_9FLAO|nr:S24 family peptidase [Wenyingzhuangia fucanilytica]ANW97472.1 DNA repair protein [Wenyingzhuangia fucanilytica]